MSLPTFDQAGFLSNLEKIAKSQKCSTTDQEIASELDQQDELKSLRDSYILPSMKDAGVEDGGEWLQKKWRDKGQVVGQADKEA